MLAPGGWRSVGERLTVGWQVPALRPYDAQITRGSFESSDVDFRILGPLEVYDGGRRVQVDGGQQRTLLALLLLRSNEVVPVDEIIDELWHSEPPPSATKSVHALVSKLRRTLEGKAGGGGVGTGENGVLLTHAHGYVLRVAAGELDLDRFQSLLEEGRRALAAGRPDEAAETIREALSLWRGAPLAEFAHDSFAQVEIGRLEELRLSALEDRVEADLALGGHHELVSELEALAAENPLRERVHAQLMLSLYRSGRQAEALHAYQRTRRMLVDELGIDPGQALQRLEKAILVQDASLEIVQLQAAPARVATSSAPEADAEGADARPATSVPVRAEIEHRRLSRIPLIAALGVLVVVVAAGGVYLDVRGAPATTTTVQPNSVGIIDPASNKIVGEVPVGARPGQVVAGAGGIWVANLEDSTVIRLDPTTRRLVRTISTEDAPIALTASDRYIWAVSASFTLPYATIVRKIDPRVNDVVETTRLEGSSYPGTPGGGASADRRGELWVVTCCLGLVSRIERGTSKVVSRIATGGISPGSVAVGAGATWVADTLYNEVARIAPTDVVVARIPVGRTPSAIAVGAGGVWVAVSGENVVRRIDPFTNVLLATIPVGHSPGAIAVAAGAVWVANGGDGTVSRIDPDTDRVVATVEVGGSPQGIAVAAGRVWVTVQAGGGAEVSPGGTLLVTSQEEPDSLDPALAYQPLSWQLEYATCAKLLNYPDRLAPQGSRLVPEVAESLPAISPDRKTYTFTIRKGFRFSPPSGAPVTAQTFKFAIERGLKLPPRLYGHADDIVGATAYATGKAPNVAGIAATGNRLTIRLSKPSPWFLEWLAEPLFCAVPLDTPLTPRGVPLLPAAGPYYFASHRAGREIVLKRNPNYAGDRSHRLQEIRVRIGVSPGQSIEQIEAGKTDYTLDYGLVAGANARLASRYGPGSPAARAGRQRYFLNPALGLDFLVLNTSRPPFADVKLREAVNYAIDRRALARLGFSTAPAVPTDQYLIPGARGFRDARIYPFSPDLAIARRLTGGKHPRVVFYNCTTPNCREHGAIIEKNLEAAGFRVEVKDFPLGVLLGKLNNPQAKHEPFDLAVNRRFHGTPDPFDFLNWYLDAKLGANGGLFDDVDSSRKLERAAMMTGPRRDRAYGELDIDLARNTAPMVAFSHQTRQDFFSARTGCQVYVPAYGMDIAALCIRR
jgi:YVTN family beta-propeller protein